MSIINLEKTLENNLLIYCNLDNIIIECISLTKIYVSHKGIDYNKNLAYFYCDKVKIITIYDIYKNIISKPIQTDIFEDPVESNDILENLEYIHFFKTFIGAFIINNKLNNIKYTMNINGYLFNFLYDKNDFFFHNMTNLLELVSIMMVK